MNDTHVELLELCAGHALGALDARDQARLERHLETPCPKCEQALAGFAEAALVLAASAPPVTPDPALKRRVLDAVARAAGPQSSPPETDRVLTIRPARRIDPWAVAAGLGWAAAAACLAFAFVQYRSLGALSSEIAGLRAERALIQQQLAEERKWGAALTAPGSRIAYFTPTPGNPLTLTGWAIYDPASQRAMLAFRNLGPEPGHDYELWAIRQDGPRSLGVIEVDGDGRAMVRLTELVEPADLAAFAVSFEAKGGSPDKRKPSGPVVLVGALSS